MNYLPYHHDWPLAFEGRLGFRVHWFGRYAGYPEWQVEKSRLMGDMVSFFFVEKEACWVVINGVRLDLQQGDLLVSRGGDEFYFGHDAKKPHISLAACLAVEKDGAANTLLHYAFDRRYSLVDPAAYTERFDRVLETMAGKGAHRGIAVAGAVSLWLAELLDILQAPVSPAFAETRITVDSILSAEAWALSRLAETITLKSWAASAGLTPDYFSRLFRKHTGRRPMEWLNERRLQRVSQMLLSTPKPVAEIAESCGFSCPFYLSRSFKKHFGRSPLTFRREAFRPSAARI